MGETLYGDPSLCIRELLQNALDAVDLYYKPFGDWTEDDKRHAGRRSVIWFIETGEVLIADGMRHRDEMRKVGNAHGNV